MTTLCRSAYPMGDDRRPHAHMVPIRDRNEGFGPAGCDTGEIFTEEAWRLLGKDDRRPVSLMENDGAVRAGFCTITALRASIQEQRFGHRSRRAQPIGSWSGGGFFGTCLRMLGVLPRSLGDGQHRVLEEIPTTIFGISSHVSYLSAPVGDAMLTRRHGNGDSFLRHATSHRLHGACTLLRTDHRRRIRRPIPDGFPG